MSKSTVAIPTELDEANLERFLQESQTATHMWCKEESVVDGSWFAEHSMPSLKHFVYQGCRSFEHGGTLFAAIPNLVGLNYFPIKKSLPQDSQFLECINRCGRWERLEYLNVYQRPSSPGFEDRLHWPALWQGRILSFVELNLSFVNKFDARVTLQAKLPRLERMRLGAALGDPLLDWILSASLPSLQYLDLRFNLISPAALTHFAQEVRARCPKLNEISIDFFDSEKTEYHDWDGSIVESFYADRSDEETTRLCLAGSGLHAVPGKTLYS
jgi:hypothetical protein